MRNNPTPYAEKHRIKKCGYWSSTEDDGNNGVFCFNWSNTELIVMVSDGGGWDHVSVSHKKRCPTWDEMCRVKDIFFDPDECVMQLHPPISEYVNNHPTCLHMWAPQHTDIPMPPSTMVGYKKLSPSDVNRMSSELMFGAAR